MKTGFCNAHGVKLVPTGYAGGTWNVCSMCEKGCKAVGLAFVAIKNV